MKTPVLGPNCTYLAKLMIHTNNELKNYINYARFQDYLFSELITVDVNGLKSIIPYNVVILEQVSATCNTAM
jgi:hypothetical protein